MSNIHIDLIKKSNLWKDQKNINKKLITNIFNLVLNYLDIKANNKHLEFSVILTDDIDIKDFNKNHRNKDNPTNVLTFSLYNDKKDIIEDIKKLPYMSLGDIIFSFETIKKESEEQNKTFLEHFIHLLVHSFLHLFCYDHIEEDERIQMEKMEINILKEINIKNPYEI